MYNVSGIHAPETNAWKDGNRNCSNIAIFLNRLAVNATIVNITIPKRFRHHDMVVSIILQCNIMTGIYYCSVFIHAAIAVIHHSGLASGHWINYTDNKTTRKIYNLICYLLKQLSIGILRGILIAEVATIKNNGQQNLSILF